jgi:hypothetical protein
MKYVSISFKIEPLLTQPTLACRHLEECLPDALLKGMVNMQWAIHSLDVRISEFSFDNLQKTRHWKLVDKHIKTYNVCLEKL